MVRRHTRGLDRLHYGPALQTVSGNYVAAKRKGVVDGVDYGFTGAVRIGTPHPEPTRAVCPGAESAPSTTRFAAVAALRHLALSGNEQWCPASLRHGASSRGRVAVLESVHPLLSQRNAVRPLLRPLVALLAASAVLASSNRLNITLCVGGAQVRFVQVASIARQLDAGAVVLLSNLGFSAAGEVLNCDIYQVGATFHLCTSPFGQAREWCWCRLCMTMKSVRPPPCVPTCVRSLLMFPR